MKIFILSILMLSTSGLMAQYQDDVWGAYINVEGELNGSGEHQFKPTAFVPMYRGDDNIVFIDLRGYLRNPLQGGVNLGFGYRHMVSDNIILGANLVYDGEVTDNGTYFNQLGLGLEMLTPYTDLRINFYLPEGDKNIPGSEILYGRLNGTKFEVIYKPADIEHGMPGIDGSFTATLPLPYDFFLNATVGGFVYFGGEFFDNVYGVAGILGVEKDFMIGNLDITASLDVGYQYDTINGGNFFGGLGVRIPLGQGERRDRDDKSSIMNDKMNSQLERNSNIVTDTRIVSTEASVLPGTTEVEGNVYSDLYQFDATDDVEGEIEGLGDNTLVLLRGEEGVIHISSAIDMNEGQTIIGDGYVFEVTGPQGQKCYVIVDSERATLVNDSTSTGIDGNTINMNNNTLVADINLAGNSSVLYAKNVDEAKILGVSILGGTQGIYSEGTSDLEISNVTIANSQTGIVIYNSTGTQISNVDISGVQNGLVVQNSSYVVAEDMDIEGAVSGTTVGILVGDSNHITFNRIDASGLSYGIAVFSADNVSINNSAFTGNDVGIYASAVGKLNINSTTANYNVDGVVIHGTSSSNITFNNSTANYNINNGLTVDGAGSVLISNSTTSENSGSGTIITNADETTINGLTADSNDDGGLVVADGGDLTMNDVSGCYNGDAGIYIYNMEEVEGSGLVVNGNFGNGLTIDGADIVDISDITADSNAFTGVMIADVASVVVENLVATNNLDAGLYIDQAFLSVIRNVIASGNGTGILVTSSSGFVQLDGVSAENNYNVGIEISDVASVEILNSFAQNNYQDGVHIFFADDVVMTGVTVTNNGNIGIYFYDVWMATTTDVTVEDNGQDFVDLP